MPRQLGAAKSIAKEQARREKHSSAGMMLCRGQCRRIENTGYTIHPSSRALSFASL
jgi:hypothetical protein